MTINDLLALTGLTANDEIPVWDAEATGEPTKKITLQNAAASLAALSGQVLTPSAAIAIPASGSSVSMNMTGLTSDHELVRWNFSASAENAPPVGLTWTTYNGYFTITNGGGSTSESIRPVFALPSAITITNH